MAENVPEALWLVESYLNSVNVELTEDDLDSVGRFRRWLGDHGRASAGDTATVSNLALARELRDELREVLRAHADGATGGSTRLDVLAARVPLRARFTGGQIRLEPIGDGVTGFLGEVLAAVVAGEGDDTWRRLKICREDTCQFVFYDRSKNASRCWCSMRVCGNRNKTRAYRRRAASPLSPRRAENSGVSGPRTRRDSESRADQPG